MKFKIGDLIVIKGASSIQGKLVDIWATQTSATKNELLLGVEFKHSVPGGHSCRQKGKPGHCLYVNADDVVNYISRNKSDEEEY